MAAISDLLAPVDDQPSAQQPTLEAKQELMPPSAKQEKNDDRTEQSPAGDGATGDEDPKEPMYTSTTTSTRRNASGSVSSVYSGNKIRHLKKEDGIPLWRKDIQFDFLHLVFYDDTKCFTKYSDGSKDHTFAEVYIDSMAKSSKCSKILKEKLLQDTDGALCMAMVCLLVNVGRMNTTLNFFPEMRAQLRTYHSIPALQAHQDPNAYKQLQDAPRLKSILKGATEDTPQPSTIEEIQKMERPRTNAVNLIFVMAQYAPKVSETHFQPPRDFFDLVMRSSLSSQSRAKAFLWLLWWYLESDFSYEDSQRNPFGPGQYAEGEKENGLLPLKIPTLVSLTDEQAAAENVDTEEETMYGEVKRKERIAILASEPSPAMTALKRARKEKGLVTGGGPGALSDDEASEAGLTRPHTTGRNYGLNHETGSDGTRSPSPPAPGRGFQAVNAKPTGDMRINNLLNNEDAASELSPPHNDSAKSKGGPGRGNWRRSSKTKDQIMPPSGRSQDERSHHIPLLPNMNAPGLASEASQIVQPATPGGYDSIPAYPYGLDHVPTPSYQAQKRVRGVNQHQSAAFNHRKYQIDYTLDRRIRNVHINARRRREMEGPILRAWKRMRYMPTDYDSEEEQIKIRKAKDRADKDEDWRAMQRGKENQEGFEDGDSVRRPRVFMAGLVRTPNEPSDVGEEATTMARTLMRCGGRFAKWDDDKSLPGDEMIRRRRRRAQGYPLPRRGHLPSHEPSIDRDGLAFVQNGQRTASRRHRSGTGRSSGHRGTRSNIKDEQRTNIQPDDEDGGGELDEEDRELLGEVDADESEEDDEDDEMADD